MRARKLAEPAATQEVIRERFGGPRKGKADAYGQTRAQRKDAIQDLKRVPGPTARKFRQENPDADIYDWERSQKK